MLLCMSEGYAACSEVLAFLRLYPIQACQVLFILPPAPPLPLRRSLDTGLDGAWVRGLRLSLPLPCMHEAVLGARNASVRAEQDCVPPLPANLTVFVGDTPPAQLLERTGGRRDGSSLCTAGVAVPAGRPTMIDCGRFMHGELVPGQVTLAGVGLQRAYPPGPSSIPPVGMCAYLVELHS